MRIYGDCSIIIDQLFEFQCENTTVFTNLDTDNDYVLIID